MMRDIVLGGLLLPLRMYLQPRAFREEVASLAPDLPEDYSLWQARRKLRDPGFRRALHRLILQSAVALLWGPLLAGLTAGALAVLGFEVSWVGVAFGVAFGVAGGVALGVAGGIAATLTLTHLLTIPVYYAMAVLSWLLVRLLPDWSPRLWPFSPVRWDEVILLPLPGLTGLLVALYHTDPELGTAAIAEVAAHRYRHGAAHRALVRIAGEQARRVTSAPALAAFHRELDWLSDDVSLPDDLRDTVVTMRDVSREVSSARVSDSATNRVRRLEAAADMLQPLRFRPQSFGTALSRWSSIVSTELERARRQRREEEPIPRVYAGDGRPVRPARRSESAPPFKGRETLFRHLEEALGGTEGQRSTLLLYGQRRTGKTSALLHLPERLGSRLVPAFLDLQSPKLGGAKDEVGLLGGLAEDVIEEARRHRGKRLPRAEADALAADPYPAFGRWLDRVEAALGGGTLLLCLDEFEVLERAIQEGRLDTRILSALRNVVQHHPHIAVLLSGSHRIEDLPPRWASSLISTTMLSISFLDEDDARELIEKPVESFPAIYSDTAVDRILRVTHCQPFLVQLTCALLVERMNEAGRVPPQDFVEVQDVDAVVPLALERGQNYFVDLWYNQTGNDVARRVLRAISQAPGRCLGRDRIRSLEGDERVLREALATLLRREIIEQAEGGYRIIVPLVAEYARRQVLV